MKLETETGVLEATCSKCTYTRLFSGDTPVECMKEYGYAGWTFVKRGERMMMVCNRCNRRPLGRR